MMEIVFYTSNAEKNRLDKSGYLIEIGRMEGTLRDASSVLSPSILFQIEEIKRVMDDDSELVKVEEPSAYVVYETAWRRFIEKANYAYIKQFGRYYYITDIIAVSNELFEIHFKSDPLMSFKDQIKNLDAYVTRNEFQYRAMIEDPLLTTYMDKTVLEFLPDEKEGDDEDPSKVNTRLGTGAPILTENCVLTTITGQGFEEPSVIVSAPADGLQFIRSTDFHARGISRNYVNSVGFFSGLLYRVNEDNHSNYLNFIKSFVAYPFNIPKSSSVSYVRFGKDEYTDGGTIYQSPHVINPLGNYFVINDFYAPEINSFKDIPPACSYEIYLPFYGWTDFDIVSCHGHELIVYYSVNYEDGSGVVYLYDVNDSKLLFSSPCQIGIKLAWSTSNAEQLEAQKNALGLNLAVGMLGSAINVGMGVISANPVSIAGGVMGGVKSITGHISSSSMLFPKATATFGSGFSSLFAPIQVKIRKTSRIYAPDGTKYAHEFGKPLNDVVNLSSLQGYTRVGQIRLTNIPAFDSELEEIEKDLADGVIL